MTTTSTVPDHGKQFTLYSHPGGPNPWKVAIIFEELGLSYHSIYIIFADVKKAPYIDICPNGRLPALVDHHNNDFTIWESGAMVLYLVGKYDPEEKISFKNYEDNASTVQWLMFQMSGQGPYYGHAGHFLWYHSGGKFDSAINRYVNEIRRVLSVLEKVLTDNNKEWLVGDRVSYADLSFVPWNWILDERFPLEGWQKEYPKVAEWDRKLNERPSVVSCFAQRTIAIAEAEEM